MKVPARVLKIRSLCDSTKGRYAGLACVAFERQTDGKPVAIATNGRAMVAVTWDDPNAVSSNGKRSHAPCAFDRQLIPGKVCGAKLLKKSRVLVAETHDALAKGGSALTVDGQTVVTEGAADMRFPRWRECLPSELAPCQSFVINAAALRDTLTAMIDTLGTGHAIGGLAVTINVGEPDEKGKHTKAWTLYASNGQESAIGLAMPHSDTPEVEKARELLANLREGELRQPAADKSEAA